MNPPESKTPETDGIQKKIFAILKGLSDVEDIPAILHAVSLEMDDARSLEIQRDEALAKLAEATKDKEFYRASLSRVAEACGIGTPWQLTALAENNEENYVDLLIKHIRKYGVTAIDAAMKSNDSPHHNAN